jgi:hypothetical protein
MNILLFPIPVLLRDDHRLQRRVIQGVEIGQAEGGGHERSMTETPSI